MKVLLTVLLLMMAGPVWAEQEQSDTSIIAKNDESVLKEDKIYFFAHSMCIACKDAYVYFQTKHQALNIKIADMRDKHNLELYKQCVKKFNIKNDELTLPLICMGDNYIMGWNNADEHKFDTYLNVFSGR